MHWSSQRKTKRNLKFKKCKIIFGNVNNTSLIKRILSQSIKDKRKISGIVNNAGIRQRLNFNKIPNNEIKKYLKLIFLNFLCYANIFKIFYKKKFLLQ